MMFSSTLLSLLYVLYAANCFGQVYKKPGVECFPLLTNAWGVKGFDIRAQIDVDHAQNIVAQLVKGMGLLSKTGCRRSQDKAILLHMLGSQLSVIFHIPSDQSGKRYLLSCRYG